ncbi:uncharacterized protein LOC133291683 isoform X1 [Gastrolobium bilobum]|uniref:uncharacterized protein LOC133291683 isoform X1 n=1 Tax=Gastrolobium bilobum TaxID=150636 RepID=UPI002AB25F38|nr:uncharacterized protein LOC133291683 isoform X1 [Gastrolobium bilobum]
MEDLGGTRFDGLSNAVRRKRSQTSRRPRPDSQPVSEGHDLSPLSSTPPSEDAGKASSDENAGYDTNSKRKEFNLNHCVSQVSATTGAEDDKSHKKSKKDGVFHAFYKNEPGRSGLYNKRCSEGVLAPANWKGSSKSNDSLDLESRNADICGGRNPESLSLGPFGVSQDGLGSENRVKKVKLKVGGVTRTIQANSASNGASGSGSTMKSSRSSDASRPRQKQQSNSDDNNSPCDKRSGLQGVPWKDFSRGGFGRGKEESLMGKISGKNASGKQGDKSEPVRKSKRVPKRRVLDDEFGDDDEDDEIRYLEKLKTSKVSAVYRDEEELSKKRRKLSSVSNMENASSSRSGKNGKKRSRSDKMYEDTDYEDEEESVSDGDLEDKKKKKQRKESVDVLMDSKREMTLTTRQRALQSSKDASASGASLIEFPNGLPPAPPRKQKEKLSEVEQQLKKAEAAQRRKMQVEKAARESEEEAIRKILCQDSSRKKREDKIKKRQEELAQEKEANARMLASSTIRYVMGPTGTVVTFPDEMGLPSILNSKPVSYPPPREKCAGPSCSNPYKYRDSKSKLPLCSLQCYKAVQGKTADETIS